MYRSTRIMMGTAVGLAVTLGLRAWRDRRRSRRGRPRDEADPVDVASDDSFPASDPPSYSPTTASGPIVQQAAR